MATAWQVRTGSAEDLDLVGPLWVAVHHRHAETMPELGALRQRRARRGAFVARCTRNCWPNRTPCCWSPSSTTTAVGYGLAHVLPVDETWIPDTWVTGSRIGEIESLSVLPQSAAADWAPNCSVGLEEHLLDQGVDDLILGALPAIATRSASTSGRDTNRLGFTCPDFGVDR